MTQSAKDGNVRVHIVGIKGVAMAALALYLKGRGFDVTGCDRAETFPTDAQLLTAHIPVTQEFNTAHITTDPPDIVYFTGAHGGRDNPEVAEAIRRGIPAFPHGIGLGLLLRDIRQIVVSGCHGKTTTSAMVATILSVAGKQPSYAIGCGSIPGIGGGGAYGTGEWFVVEGDEYVTDPGHDLTPRFHWLVPEILVVTNIDYDHPDVYPNLGAVQQAFSTLADKCTDRSSLIVNADDPGCVHLRVRPGVITVGQSPQATYRITDVRTGSGQQFFSLHAGDVTVGDFTLIVPGIHNVYNAASAAVAAYEAGVSWSDIVRGLGTFRGTARRFENIGTVKGAVCIDDYAHHPAEIESTIAAARSWFPGKKIIAVFQPHTYSRTKSLLSRFARSFSGADSVILTDIYASAREHDTLGITGMTLVTETGKQHPRVVYAPRPNDVAQALVKTVTPESAVIFMGAGDVYTWSRQLVEQIRIGAYG